MPYGPAFFMALDITVKMSYNYYDGVSIGDIYEKGEWEVGRDVLGWLRDHAQRLAWDRMDQHQTR